MSSLYATLAAGAVATLLAIVRARRHGQGGDKPPLNRPTPESPRALAAPPLSTEARSEERSPASADARRDDTAVTFAKEAKSMDDNLTHAELQALLGNSGSGSAESGVSTPGLLSAGDVAAQALASYLCDTETWQASEAIVTNWAEVASCAGLKEGTPLMLVEVRLVQGGGSAYVAATTLAACRLDEQATLSGHAGSSDVAFLGWRKVVELMLTDTCRALAAGHSVDLVPRALPPRRWDPFQQTGAMPGFPAGPVVLFTLSRRSEQAERVHLLFPAATLTLLLGQPVLAEVAATETDVQPEDAPSLDVVAGIPLDIAFTLAQGKLPVRTVAAWNRGTMVPLACQPGQEVGIRVNGELLARGRLVQTPDQNLAVEITTLLPLSPDAGC